MYRLCHLGVFLFEGVMFAGGGIVYVHVRMGHSRDPFLCANGTLSGPMFMTPRKNTGQFEMYPIDGVHLIFNFHARLDLFKKLGMIHMFLGLLDPDPSVRGIDPDPDLDPSITSKKSKKSLDSYCFVTSF
jgi:hypothetical protein